MCHARFFSPPGISGIKSSTELDVCSPLCGVGSWDWSTTGEETTVGENSVFDPLEEPVPAQAPMPAASHDFSSSFGFDDQHAGGSGLPLDPAAAQADTPFSVSFVFDDDHAVGAAQVQSQIPDSSMTLPPVDTSAMWNIRLVIAGKRGITDLDETMLSARCTAFLTNLGYTGTVRLAVNHLKWGKPCACARVVL